MTIAAVHAALIMVRVFASFSQQRGEDCTGAAVPV